MPLTEAHLRYLLAIYEVSQTHLDISSRSIAEVRAQLERVLQNFPPVNIELTEEERFAAALALTSALPERAFVGEYERLFGTVSDETAEPEKAG